MTLTSTKFTLVCAAHSSRYHIALNILFIVIVFSALTTSTMLIADAKAASRQVISSGDVIHIEVRGEEEVTGDYKVMADGSIQKAWLPKMTVKGLTYKQAKDVIEKQLHKYYRHPVITVSMKDFAEESVNNTIRVTGAVNNAASFPYREGYTVFDAILDAKGFSKFAAPNSSKIVRGVGKEKEEIKVKLGDVYNNGDTTQNVKLKPGDILVVPKSLF